MGRNGFITPEHIYAKARIFSEGAIIDGAETPPFAQGLASLTKARSRDKLCAIPPTEPQPLEIAPEQVEQIWLTASQVMQASASESKPSSATRFTFDESGLTTFVHANKYSRLRICYDVHKRACHLCGIYDYLSVLLLQFQISGYGVKLVRQGLQRMLDNVSDRP